MTVKVTATVEGTWEDSDKSFLLVTLPGNLDRWCRIPGEYLKGVEETVEFADGDIVDGPDGVRYYVVAADARSAKPYLILIQTKDGVTYFKGEQLTEPLENFNPGELKVVLPGRPLT